MKPEFCVCICSSFYWFLQDFGNDIGGAHLYWTIEPDLAYRFTRHESAISLAQIVKYTHPEVNVRLMEAPREAPHDSNPA